MAYSPLGDKAQLEQMLVYATLHMSINELPVNAQEFQKLVTGCKKIFLDSWASCPERDHGVFISSGRKSAGKLLVLDHSVFEKNINDIEDQLDLMSLSDFVYRKPSDVWVEFPRYLKALILRFRALAQ